MSPKEPFSYDLRLSKTLITVTLYWGNRKRETSSNILTAASWAATTYQELAFHDAQPTKLLLERNDKTKTVRMNFLSPATVGSSHFKINSRKTFNRFIPSQGKEHV
jgi:hypothetical protein